VRLYLFNIEARNRPGALARVCRRMALYGINLEGFVADQAGIQVLVKDEGPARQALAEGGFEFTVKQVHEVQLEDRPGTLAELAERLAAAGINIETAFGLASSHRGRIYLDVSDLARAAPILETVNMGTTVVHPWLGRIP
jgi:hypothetical protein